MPTIGERIRDIREQKRLTQDRLAEISGISKGFLSDLENDKRNVSSEYILRIANALGASVDFLLTGETRSNMGAESVVIPPELSQAAEQLNLTYSQTITLLDAHRSVVARRSNQETKRFSVDDWIAFHKLVKEVFG
jgi:transcriptional regulator with XRE-family HTH domain